MSTFDCRDLDLHDPFYGCEVEPEAPEGELREEQARVLALRAAALLGPQVARAAGKRRVNKAALRWLVISPLHAEALHAAAELRDDALLLVEVQRAGEAVAPLLRRGHEQEVQSSTIASVVGALRILGRQWRARARLPVLQILRQRLRHLVVHL